MAMDGSFCLESELRRFLARCPQLASVPRFVSLLEMGDRLTEEEVVDLVAEVFLHPNYTIPLVGCFRPIVQKIVDRVVGLLGLVPDLRSDSEEMEVECEAEGYHRGGEDFISGVGNVIEYYAGRGRGLTLHELSCLAFCRALDLVPFLLGALLRYFKFAPPPFERILKSRPLTKLLMQDLVASLNAVRSSYRLLLLKPEVFSKLWDWSCFLKVARLPTNIDACENTKNMESISDISWCAVQIVSVTLKISERVTTKFGLETEQNFASLLRWEDFCKDVSLEKAGWYVGMPLLESVSCPHTGIIESNCIDCSKSLDFKPFSDSSVDIREIEPSIRARRTLTWDAKSTDDPFIVTSNMKKCAEMVQLAVSQKWPVLLYGPAGAGKTALISMLARKRGRQVLSIHMDDQIDGKTLVGTYVCTEEPGQFRWQPGSLTLAVMNGFWVVFEDVDKSPLDVQSILLPLLEGSATFSTGHGEVITVAEGFQLFGTLTNSKLDVSCNGEGWKSLSLLWRRVMIPPPSKVDLQDIVKAWYPNLEPLTGSLIDMFEMVNSVSIQKRSGFLYGRLDSFGSSRFSLRDLLKWCKRINNLGFHFVEDGLSPTLCNSICKEAVDVFAAYLSSAVNRVAVMDNIAKHWAVPVSVLSSSNKAYIQDYPSELRIGRITLERIQTAFLDQKKPFVEIRSSLHVLEGIACSVKHNEPVLLVGETGTGKTTLVQNLASRLGQRLIVLNLSQQSDAADLLGGFKPMDARFVCIPLYNDFMTLFSKTFRVESNAVFISHLQDNLKEKSWLAVLCGFQKGVDRARKKLAVEQCGPGKKRKKHLKEELLAHWENFSAKVQRAYGQIVASSGAVFSFVEGAFVSALSRGDWILLDEINLAPPETLQRIIGVLDGENGSLCLAERGDVNYIHRHANFRIFACMNPATDAGKRDLPYSLRSRFTEYFVDDVLDDEDLSLFVNKFIDDTIPNRGLVSKIVHFYKAAKKASEEKLQDGANQKPQFSLRSLYRALEYTRKARNFEFDRALYDGFCMFFLTMLDGPSAKLMNAMILHYLLDGKKEPRHVPFDSYLTTRAESVSGSFFESYVLTESVKHHLKILAQATLIKRYPVLLQGPTSSGKTSMVQYLAAITGHEFVRINNHEHTDLQEYLGSYITDASGKLVFHEGVLVKAVRNGYWIVLDELNLAPSDVLEALNRLLDDNRELFVPELGLAVQAHKDFMLFATQNPPTFYGGRKMLSQAFRNRFVEIHVDEIPEDELSTILVNRCAINESKAKVMVEVMKDLQLHRQRTKVFAGRHGFITPRDLFRWADRSRKFCILKEDLAREGYLLLAERLRDETEKGVVQEVLEKHLRVKLGKDDLYKQEPSEGDSVSNVYKNVGVGECLGQIIWTQSMQRLYYLVARCYELRQPVLLVGETGGGKTTVCQVLSQVLASKLHILNCHQHTEASDFLGGFYPIRDRTQLTSDFQQLIDQLLSSKAYNYFPGDVNISRDIHQASLTLEQLSTIIDSYKQGLVSCIDVSVDDLKTFEQLKLDLAQLNKKWQSLFMWQDGPLVQAMRDGDLFVVDEISLADDSVLERLNSVLESERRLLLAEKGGSDLEEIVAHPNFFLLATMNPGGDYGKKELSPALRNRFTEIWVPSVTDLDELESIALHRFSRPDLLCLVAPMLNFWNWFNQLQIGQVLTVRDLLSWVDFINVTVRSLQLKEALLHGVFLVLLDGLTLGTSIPKRDVAYLQERCFLYLSEQLKEAGNVGSECMGMETFGWGDLGLTANISCNGYLEHKMMFGIDPFYIEKGNVQSDAKGFEFVAPTTCKNTLRLLRALQLSKPVLLEGSPGVGKTSLIVALGKYSGHRVVRINLSEQTDMMDLLGSDLPVESNEGLKFSWSDGILLQALKEGCWVLLDELNLAPQSVLEGLNAILDHRAEVFIPELNHTFKCPSSFRVFACQNPSSQGGGRKVLPRSFLNRFTKVYVDELVEEDYLCICSSLYPSIPRSLLSKLIVFNRRLHEDTMLHYKFAQDGSPWEFNLRDVIRSCQLIQDAPEKLKESCFLNIIYVQRMRTAADRSEVLQLYEHVFGVKPHINPFPRVQLNSRYLFVGRAAVRRATQLLDKSLTSELKILPGIRLSLEAVAQCVQYQWLCILIGPSACGKTSLVRLLAQLSGNVLNELNLSSATDISEIVGCFEQYNAFRSFHAVVAQVEHYVNEFCSLEIEYSVEKFINEKSYFISRWLAFLSSINSVTLLSATSASVEHCETGFHALNLLVEILRQLQLDGEKISFPASWSRDKIHKTLETALKLQEDFQRRPSAKFVWVSGLLIKAIQNGEWIVLEDANVCNPTVLDRINSLVEPNGSIMVNECGIVDGEPMVLHPHPNFRMFLTVNPNHGQVSRAMRNRGVEIFIMPPCLLFERDGCDIREAELKDVKRFLVLSGIPVGKLVELMAAVHIYARDEGRCLNISITYLELSRWIQLFQRLLVNGNQPLWSLWTSLEHTYISSLGEPEGCQVVMQAKASYLSWEKIFEHDLSVGYSLCLPGGWPTPLKLRDLVCYSKESAVKQNVVYLEFLGAQFAASKYSIVSDRYQVYHALGGNGNAFMYLVNIEILGHMMFPIALKKLSSGDSIPTESNLQLANKMLFFAATWLIEQATEADLKLYMLWFNWMNSQLSPFCMFFGSFVTLLEQELKHSIWSCIIRCRNEILSRHHADSKLHQIPILSIDLVDLAASDNSCGPSRKLLSNAIKCIGLLRLYFQQRNAEISHKYSDNTQCFASVLKCLRMLEEEILDMIVESPFFDTLFKAVQDLLQDHMLFWNSILSNCFEDLLTTWRSVNKKAARLWNFCRRSFEIFQLESKNLNNVSLWVLNSQKSLLWVHGGHPFVPPSSDLFFKQHQLLILCESIWPTQEKALKHVTESSIELVVSSNPELRTCAAEGVCMSLRVVEECEENDVCIIQKLDDMRQILWRRFEHEKQKLLSNQSSGSDESIVAALAACCVFGPAVWCNESGFNGWKETLAMIDRTSLFLDMHLLNELAEIDLDDANNLQLAFSGLSELLQFAFNYSLNHSSRSPINFLPHQKILWTIDAWTAASSANSKIASFILEMWFRWHSSLWSHSSVYMKQFMMVDGCGFPLPEMLFQPVMLISVMQIMESAFTIKDYYVRCLKLRAACRNLWQTFQPGTDVRISLLYAARSLLRQIIYAHKKSFDVDNYVAIKSILSSSQKEMLTQDKVHLVSSLIASSRHKALESSLKLFIEPLLEELFLLRSSADSVYDLGLAWLQIGGLRLRLLLCCDDLDPVLKYSFKYSQLLEMISSVELEIKVRQESTDLVGWSSSREVDKQKVESLRKLEDECRGLKRKIVFRSDPGKFKKLKSECDEFLKLVTSFIEVMRNVSSCDSQQMTGQICNLQETAACFIDRLSDEYYEYVDIIQPVQVAACEMKLGLSLVLSSDMQNKILSRVEEDNLDRILGTVYSFMRFPRICATESLSVEVDSRLSQFPYSRIIFPTNIWETNMKLLEQLVSTAGNVAGDKMVSAFQQKASIHYNILLRLKHFVANARLLDKASFMLMDKIFSTFTNLWTNMKDQAKTTEDVEALQYKFKARVLKIEKIFELDASILANSLADESFSGWREVLSVAEFSEREQSDEEHEDMEYEWDLVQDSIWKNMVHTHCQLFGSIHLVAPGYLQMPDEDQLHSFVQSYTLGSAIIQGLGGLISSQLDAKLVPEHLLRLCVEHEQNSASSIKLLHKYNFYKDSNAPEMAKMVKLLVTIQQRIHSLLIIWEDHPGLQSILNTVKVLLSLPQRTSLSKALSGLQFLLGRAWMLRENGFDFSLADQVKPVLGLVSSWQEMEFNSWPVLLDEVESQYDLNAAKLWFPLYLVLQRSYSADIAAYNHSTIQSLVEFIQTSSIGEFRKRLELLFAFYGQLKIGISLGLYSSPCQKGNLEILYNLFGFYVQYLPRILEYMVANRRTIVIELNELLKLSRWEHFDCSLSLENVKRTRQKFKKLVQKYNDLLQQPVMLIFNHEAALMGIETKYIGNMKLLGEVSAENEQFLNVAFDLIQSRERFSSVWFDNWKKEVDNALKILLLAKPEISVGNRSSENKEGSITVIIQHLVSHSVCLVQQKEWKAVWYSLEKLCRYAGDCCELWMDASKGRGKRRALSELLKLFEGCGLSRHKSVYLDDQSEANQLSRWFLKPSYDGQHLLLTRDRLPSAVVDMNVSSKLHTATVETLDAKWRRANKYYFKSLASVQLLQQICLNFCKDITLEQVNRSLSFLNHLIVIQQEQRAASYRFAGNLGELRKCLFSLKNLCSSGTGSDEIFRQSYITPNQHATIKFMWQQKKLFDHLCSMLDEESLLLRTFESAHLDTCATVKFAAKSLLSFIEKFVPVFQKSKGLLDNYLLGPDKVMRADEASILPGLISEQMEKTLHQNFQVIKDFEDQLSAFRGQDVHKSSVKEALLCHFDDVIKQGNTMGKEFCFAVTNTVSTEPCDETKCCDKKYSELQAAFDGAVQSVLDFIAEALHKLGSSGFCYVPSEESFGRLTSWKSIFEFYSVNLHLDAIYSKLLITIIYARELVNQYGSKIQDLCAQVGQSLKFLSFLLELLLNYSEGLLRDSLAMNETVSLLTSGVANAFSSLFCKGFGTSTEDQVNDHRLEISQDTKGTGMGEGAGLNDVSDQIYDEDQLLGASDKPYVEKDDSSQAPNKNDKGIEMSQDFAADTCSVSEDSGEDDEDGCENEELEKAMGKTGDDGEVVDEKLWDKDEDEAATAAEKYESGSGVKDKDSENWELRAKEDEPVTAAVEPGELKPEDGERKGEEIESPDGLDDIENLENMQMDKNEAYAEPTGIEFDESTQQPEDIDMDVTEGKEPAEGEDSEVNDEPDENQHGKGETDVTDDEPTGDEKIEKVDASADIDPTDNQEKNAETDCLKPRKDASELNSNFNNDFVPNPCAANQLPRDMLAADSTNLAPEINWSNSDDVNNDLAPVSGSPSTKLSDMDAMFGDSKTGTLTDDSHKSQLPQHGSSPVQKTQSNPYRNLGDALEEWKERVIVSTDLKENAPDIQEDMIDDDADEYGYVHELNDGAAQALGPCTSDQIDRNIKDRGLAEDGRTPHKEDVMDMEVEKHDSEIHPSKSHPMLLRNKYEESILDLEEEKLVEGSPEADRHEDGTIRNVSESTVNVKKNYMSEELAQLRELTLNYERKSVENHEELSNDVKVNAGDLWRKYELVTTRLSQELAEQLRLIMEPSLASRLQGDYKTGKRINMKKVIPYIASHFRKDKIWLRRTRPNKRDYQVVIAVDDSRSMSESSCGDFAIEALVTVCRAMSQLEVGKLAVASFGKKGNTRLLHDFDQPFTGEAGVKMISSLSFKQENTIAEEPMVDLLKYLNNMLDAAVANARLPSGQNPLQQLVLIIADGRFHEKEKLKHFVRDFLNRKRMVAFLLLDSPEESIMDVMEASVQGREVKMSKYLDSFPFPYYIILRNIEELPRTLGDLLRQWFEITQSAKD